jgi:hypothetical protein
MWAELFCLSSYLPDSGRGDRSEARGWASDAIYPTGRPAPPPLSPSSRCTTTPPRTSVVAAAPPGGRRRASRRSKSVRTPRGWLEPARGEFPAPNSPLGPPPAVCHMPDFWVTGRPINPLNASVATFCAAGVISMHQTTPGMVRGGVSGVSRGRFVTMSTQAATASVVAHRCCFALPRSYVLCGCINAPGRHT